VNLKRARASPLSAISLLENEARRRNGVAGVIPSPLPPRLPPPRLPSPLFPRKRRNHPPSRSCCRNDVAFYATIPGLSCRRDVASFSNRYRTATLMCNDSPLTIHPRSPESFSPRESRVSAYCACACYRDRERGSPTLKTPLVAPLSVFLSLSRI
jgi:hypothetical protein